MTDAVKISAVKNSDRHGAGVLGPVIRSAVGVVRESAGLVYNVAELGLSLVLDTRKIAPGKTPTNIPSKTAPRRLDAPGASNVIPFSAARKIGRPIMNRGW